MSINFSNIFKKVFGSSNERLLSQYSKTIDSINALEESLKNLSDEDLRNKSGQLKIKYNQNKNLDEILPEAFAVVREASQRTIGLRHYDVQLIGGLVLHNGKISEMKTGEGKTLVSTLPAYLNALAGTGVHIVTVNEYLAERDSDWMRPIYEFLGLSVGFIRSEQTQADKRAAYNCDITYGTNNEFGFDYLRDNLSYDKQSQAQVSLALPLWMK